MSPTRKRTGRESLAVTIRYVHVMRNALGLRLNKADYKPIKGDDSIHADIQGGSSCRKIELGISKKKSSFCEL